MMPEPIHISDFKGLVTNADLEDIAPEYLPSLKNLRSVNGKLVKTFGIGNKIADDLSNSIVNLYTYTNISLSAGTQGGKILIGIFVDTESDNQITIYAYSESSDSWVDITYLSAQGIPEYFSGTYYHAALRNAIHQDNEVLRISPGTSNVLYNGNPSKGIWFGLIDRNFFDGLYTPIVGFYDYATEITKPDISSSGLAVYVAQKSGGDNLGPYNPGPDHPGEQKWYKFSYTYDGNQESLLSDVMSVNFEPDSFAILYFNIITASFNKRITALNVYRSDFVNGDFRLIGVIDFLRQVDDSLTGNYARYSWKSSTNTYIYIPTLEYFSFDASANNYRLVLNDDATNRAIQSYIDEQGDGYLMNGNGYNVFDTLNLLSSEYWDVSWVLYEQTGKTGDYNQVASGSSGAFAGINIALLFDYTGDNVSDMVGGALHAVYGNGYYVYKILNNHGKAINIDGYFISSTSPEAVSWFLVSPTHGQYIPRYKKKYILFVGNAGGSSLFITREPHNLSAGATITHSGFTESTYNGEKTVASVVNIFMYTVAVSYVSTDTGIATAGTSDLEYLFFDTGLTGTEPHPLEGEVSININAQFEKIINDRKWMGGKMYLDPSGDNQETRYNLIAYSEYKQVDVCPVSNTLRIIDKESGTLTGIAELYGNPVYLLTQGLYMIDTKSNPGNPALWVPLESAHNIGNIAEQGFIEVAGSLYICYHDGIYRIRPNNLSPSDSTPTEKLKITGPIEDVYQALTQSQKEDIESGYNPLRGEIVFNLNGSLYAFNVETETWREIESGITVSMMAKDENDNLIVYDDTDKKIYSFAETESVGFDLKTKTFRLSDDTPATVERVTAVYKSDDELTMKVYLDNDIPSGDIQPGVEYTVVDYTTVTYAGVEYNDGDTFTGVPGKKTYSVTGSGTVQTVETYTLPAHNTMREEWNAPRAAANTVSVRIEDTTGSTNEVEIGRISIEAA